VPATVVLTRQTWRHVDHVAFMNPSDVGRFVGYWEKRGCIEQRMTHLYGYYSEDPNYPEGIRCCVEALYDPPQLCDTSGQTEMPDPKRHIVDMIANALGLEHVGIMFTKLD
jgi:nuclear protein localization protein 4 homolog